MSVIDTANNTVAATIGFVGRPYGVAVNPAGTRAYVTNIENFDSAVKVIDTAANSVISSISAGGFPVGITVNPTGTRVYVLNAVGTVSVINTSTNTVIAVIPGFSGTSLSISSGSLAVSPDGARVYVTDNFGGYLSVIDTATNTVSGSGPAGPWPSSIALNPAGTRAYITNLANLNSSVQSVSTSVTVLDLTTTIGP